LAAPCFARTLYSLKPAPHPQWPCPPAPRPERATAIRRGGRSAKGEILEPTLEIVDPHHHLWDRAGHRYLLDELLADTGSGHNITQSVFVECGSMYRADGPAERSRSVKSNSSTARRQ
jgi:hypothetical protein